MIGKSHINDDVGSAEGGVRMPDQGHIVLPRFGDVVVQPVLKPEVTNAIMEPFRDKHQQLGGSPGEQVTKGWPENNGTGSRVRYQDGTIYQRADGSCFWVHGAIGQRYDQLGAGTSWLGMPVSDELDFSTEDEKGGRVSRFENGSIYFWPDTGAIDINEVIIHYTGLYCFAETDSDRFGTTSDEPYVVMGVVTPSIHTPSVSSHIYEEKGGVDAGNSRPDLIEIYRGQPQGAVISVLLMEHDEGDPDTYKDAVKDGVAAGSAALATSIGVATGGTLGAIAALVLKAVGSTVVDAINGLIGAGDDTLGNTTVVLTAKQMVVLAARAVNNDQYGIGWKAQTDALTGDGSEYRVYFGLVTA